MGLETVILICGYAFGFYMSWNIGANDVANSMASAVGARAITLRQAIFIAGILNIVGAVFIGSHVTDTIRKGIVATDVLADPHMAMLGALSALLAAAFWVSFATWKSLPVSTTHSIVGAMVGFGVITGGFSVVNWAQLGAVVASWVISPFFSLVIAFIMFKIIIKTVYARHDTTSRALQLSPVFIGLALLIIVLSFLFKTPLGSSLPFSGWQATALALGVAVAGGFAGRAIISRFGMSHEGDETEKVFRRIQVGTSCYVALAQGANDVANAIGPLALIYYIVKTGSVSGINSVPVPLFLLGFGGIGIAAGIAMAGRRVIETVGSRITTLNNTRGFSVDFAAATTVMMASKLGLPVSTTHAAVGGVVGVGMARGFEAVNFRVLYSIVFFWILTVPVAAVSSMIIFSILQAAIY
ncbi:MAG: inorganic phosphate transporter [Desulfosudaceae bacterium]